MNELSPSTKVNGPTLQVNAASLGTASYSAAVLKESQRAVLPSLLPVKVTEDRFVGSVWGSRTGMAGAAVVTAISTRVPASVNSPSTMVSPVFSAS